MTPRKSLGAALVASLVLAGCMDEGRPALPPGNPSPAAAPAAAQAAPADEAVRATILPGVSQPSPAMRGSVTTLRSGDVSLNFPGADVQVVAKTILGDLLGLQFTIAQDLHTPVTVVTQRPIARADVFRLFEASLASADLALTPRNGVYAILPIEQARSQSSVAGPDTQGFATEVIRLNFVSADQFRRLIDPILPNVITQSDNARNTIVVSGTSGQRAAVRDLVRQFDADWLRNTSFALFVPQRTDSRLIVPELDKLINAEGAPMRGLVRLIAMDRLNGILAVSTQRQYLDDVRRWVEILDREGQASERRVYVYRVQNGRSADLARVLANAFGAGGGSTSGSGATRSNHANTTAPGSRDDLAPPPSGESGQPGAAAPAEGVSAATNPSTQGGGGPTNADIATGDLRAQISSDETNNAIVVFATPRDYAVVEDALHKLDVPPSQVMIEAAIVEVTLTDQLQYGVQWQFGNATSNAALSQGATSTPISIFPGFTYFYSHSTISAALNALETLTKINVVSAPKLLVLNNQTASLQVGNQVPTISATAISTIGSNAPVVNSIEYRDTGIILKITPRVNSGGVVLLDIGQEVSAVVPTLTPGIASPTISTRKISTSVAVQDGEVIALGGLISNSVTDTKSGLPIVSHIKFLSTLFGATNNQGTKTELIVLLRPRVVRSVDDGRALTDELRDKLQALRPLLPQSSIP
jgi:general secretion pathway protein D